MNAPSGKKTNRQLIVEIKILKNRIKELEKSVSKCKNEKKAMLEVKNKFQDFFDNAPVGYHSFKSDRIIYEINKAELDMIGFSRDEIVDKKTWADLILPEQKPIFEEHWKKINKTGSVHNIEYTLLHKNGHHIDVLLSATMMYNKKGKSVRTRGIVIDISSLKRAKEELENSESILKSQKIILKQKNVALKEILEQISIEKSRIKDDVMVNVEKIVLPITQKLLIRGTSFKYVNQLRKSLQELTSSFGRKMLEANAVLAPREIEICNMIKNGLVSKEIAGILNISLRTVEKHRFKARKKLRSGKKNFNLTSFLQKSNEVTI